MAGKKKKRKNVNKKATSKTKQNTTQVNNNPSVTTANQPVGLASLESTSPFADRLPFASPTLQLLQQEKLLGIKAHQMKAWEAAEKHFSHALEAANDSYPEQLPSLYSSIGLVHFHLKVLKRKENQQITKNFSKY